MTQQVIVKGKLDYAKDGVWLIHDTETGLGILGRFLYPYIGKSITVLVDEEEEDGRDI